MLAQKPKVPIALSGVGTFFAFACDIILLVCLSSITPLPLGVGFCLFPYRLFG